MFTEKVIDNKNTNKLDNVINLSIDKQIETNI